MSRFGRLGAAVAAMAMLVAAEPTSAAQKTYAAMTGEQVATILLNKGYRAEVSKDSGGDPIINSATNGLKYAIYFYGCDKETVRSCKRLQFVSMFDKDDTDTVENASVCNGKYAFGRAKVTKENYVIDYTAGVVGVTDDYLENEIAQWDTVLTLMKQCAIDAKKH